MVVEVEIKGLKQSTVFALCKKNGWEPLFFSATKDSVFAIDLERELEACLAAGEWTLCSLLLDVVRSKVDQRLMKNLSLFDRRIASQISAQGKFRPPSKILLLFPPYLKFKAQKSIQEVLSNQELSPKVYGRAKNLGLAEQWGLEMKYWYSQDIFDIVFELGERAKLLNLSHHLIAKYSSISALELNRSNSLILLKRIQQSPNRTRSDYENAIMNAWRADPDFEEYLNLLRKVITFRMRKKGLYTTLADNFEQECIDFELNKKLANFLLSD